MVRRASSACVNTAGFLPINHVNTLDEDRQNVITPMFAGQLPPPNRKHKLALALLKMSAHGAETEQLLQQL